jgi:hypothetical protein
MQNQIWIKLNDDAVRLYSPQEAADYCGGPLGAVSVQTVNRWRKTGWLRSIPIGRGYVYTKEALDECLGLRGYSTRITGEETNGNQTEAQ